MDAFTAAGLAVYALSYDEPEALRDFRDAFGMTCELLSDPQSDAIRTLGILNTFIDADDHPWYGIPFPGTYLLDAEGTVTAKFFENNLALRASPEQMLRAAGGGPVPNSLATSRCRGEVDWSVNFNGDRLAFSVLRDLLVCCDIPPGRHLYARPAPAGMVAADVEFDEHPSIWFGEVERPAATRHQLAGTGEAFDVYTGELTLRVPIALRGPVGRTDGRREVTVTGTVRWQSCDDRVCDVPCTERFELAIPVADPVRSELVAQPNAPGVRPMNAAAHFQTMQTRHRT